MRRGETTRHLQVSNPVGIAARIVMALLCLAASASAHSQMYKWMDKDGKTQYSDQPPPADAKQQTPITKLSPARPPSDEGKGKPAAAASTAEDLQTVFRNFHKAVLATDIDELLKWSVKSRSDAFAKASAAERDGEMARAAKSTPKTYKVTGSIIEPNGRDATLYLNADVTDKGNTETLHGSVVFEKEGGAWKVAAAGWGRIQSPAAARASEARR